MVGHDEMNPGPIDRWAHFPGDKDTRIRDAWNRFRGA